MDNDTMVAVTPEDREFAAQVYDARPGDWSGSSDQVRRGLHDDTALVQAFARYREMLAGAAQPIGAQTDRDAAKQLLDQLHIRERETGSFRSWDETVQAFARHRHQSGRTGAGEAHWLIERRCDPPQWSTEPSPTGIGAFYSDIHRAHRFATKQEASDAMRSMSLTPKERGEYFVSEHVWIEHD